MLKKYFKIKNKDLETFNKNSAQHFPAKLRALATEPQSQLNFISFVLLRLA